MGNVNQPQQFLLCSNVVVFERKILKENITQELNKGSLNHNKCGNKGMLWCLEENFQEIISRNT